MSLTLSKSVPFVSGKNRIDSISDNVLAIDIARNGLGCQTVPRCANVGENIAPNRDANEHDAIAVARNDVGYDSIALRTIPSHVYSMHIVPISVNTSTDVERICCNTCT